MELFWELFPDDHKLLCLIGVQANGRVSIADIDFLYSIKELTTNNRLLRGAPNDKNQTSIIDYMWPEGLTPTQEEMLSSYSPSHSDPTGLTAIEFPQVMM